MKRVHVHDLLEMTSGKYLTHASRFYTRREKTWTVILNQMFAEALD